MVGNVRSASGYRRRVMGVTPSAASEDVPRRGRRRRAVLAVSVSSAAVGFTTTAITVGTRGMAQELSLTAAELGWIVNSYLVVAAALVLAGARLGDVIGRVRTLEVGLTVFVSASLLGLVAPGFAVIIVARMLQGVGAALIMPAGIEVIAEYARDPAEVNEFRWRGLAYACSFAVGPLFGGLLTDWISWRWVFVVAGATGLVGWMSVRPLERHPGRGTHRPTDDFLGALMAAALVGLVIVLAERLAVWSIASVEFLAGIALVLVLSLALLLHERRVEHPLLHRQVIEDRRVLGANVAGLGASIGMVSLLYFFNLFAQSAASLSGGAVSVLAALALFVTSMLLCAVLAHRLGVRFGPTGPVVAGFILMIVGFGWLSRVTVQTTEGELWTALAVAGVGAGITNASLTGVAVLGLPAGRINEAAGWNGLARFLGSAIAMAVGTTTFLSVDGDGGAHPESVYASGDAFDAAVETLRHDLSGPLRAVTDAESAQRFALTMGVTAAMLTVLALLACVLLWGSATNRSHMATSREPDSPMVSRRPATRGRP